MLSAEQLSLLDEDLGFLGSALQHDHQIGPLSTYRVGGSAARFVQVSDPAQLSDIAEALNRRVRPSSEDVLVIGRGSNLLVADAGVDMLVLQLGAAFESIDVSFDGDDAVVRAGAAVSLPVLARRTVAAGVKGLEWTVGIPGSVGGAVRMNAGGHGSELAEHLRSVRIIDLCTGADEEVGADALQLRYRHSNLTPAQVVVDAVLGAERAPDSHRGADEISEIVRWRRENQPGGHNAGSVFTNPPGDSAGRLIDAAGCKGLRMGSAEVSTKHANFIQSDAGGSADDVAAVMAEVIRRVEEHAGVTLHPETVMVGFEVSWR